VFNEQKKKYLKIIGERVAQFRKQKGISQSQLSDIVELDVMTISRIERGLINISIVNAYNLSKALGITQKELFDFEF
jgi:transcriptional regulator with XRE-family HTH domain